MRFLASTLIITSGIAGQAVHPRDALERAVDQPTPQARHQAALELAGRKDIELSQWLELARTFGRFDRVASGVHREKVALVVGGEEEATEVFTYVPEGYDPAHPAPLLLMAHGAGGSGRGQDRQWRQIAADLGMLVLSPSEAQSTGGYSFTPRERRSAMAALRWARRRFNVDENRIYAAGVSRGGHLVWDLALRYPDQFAAIAPMIGSPRLQIDGGQNNLRYLENVVPLPIRDLQGARDDPRMLKNLRSAFARLEKLGAANAKLIEFPELAHDFEFDAVDWPAFLGAAVRDPRPAKIVRCCAHKGEARAYWVEVLQWKTAVSEVFRPRIAASRWQRADEDARRDMIQSEVDKRTARLDIAASDGGRFVARGTNVTRFRVLLTPAMVGEKGRVEVTFGAKKKRATIHPNAKTLLLEFVERFDRTFLPTGELIVP